MFKTMFKGLIQWFQKMNWGCVFSFVKTSIIFGTGVYTGVYIAQNYQIDKVEDPKALFEKAQAFVKSKMTEINDGKKGDK